MVKLHSDKNSDFAKTIKLDGSQHTNLPYMPNSHPTYRQCILRVLLYIEEHLDSDLTLEQLAGIACFSPFHFHRMFAAHTGETLHKYIRRLRIERAVGRLAYSDTPIVHIALEAGFETHEAFSRAFRKTYGMSPTDFRQKACEGDPFFFYQSEPPPQPRPIGTLNMKVRIEKIEPKPTVFLRHTGPYTQIGKKFQELQCWAAPRGILGPHTQVMGIYHDNPEVTPEDKLRSDAVLTVQGSIEVDGDVQSGKIPGGEYAVATHQGPYAKLAECYRWLYGKWLDQSGRLPADSPCFERYVNDPTTTPEDELLTEIYIQLK